MRVTGGKLKNRKIEAPETVKTRPLTDEIKEAIFNILGPLNDFRVLDTYAGSGSAGIEAISRGAESVDGVEISKDVARVLERNLESLDLKSKYSVHNESIESWILENQDKKGTYDLIFVDPPFDNFSEEIVERLSEFLQPRGLMELRTRVDVELPDFKELKNIKSRVYGPSAVNFYQKV